MGAREAARLAWRADVDHGNWCWRQSYWSDCMSAQRGGLRHVRAYRAIGAGDDDFELREALSAPKPWARPRAGADPPKPLCRIEAWARAMGCTVECREHRKVSIRRKRRAAQRRGRYGVSR